MATLNGQELPTFRASEPPQVLDLDQRPKFCIVNRSTSFLDDDLDFLRQLLQQQVDLHFGPAWGIEARLYSFKCNETPLPNTPQLVLLEDADMANVLGYHQLTQDGYPLGKVFVRTDITFYTSPQAVASHELLEMLADPPVNTFARGPEGFYALEVCDPVNGQGYYLSPDGLRTGVVANFVFPSWFNPLAAAPFSHVEAGIAHPFALGAAGYIQVTDGQTWRQLTGEQAAGKETISLHGRRALRQLPLEKWQK